MIEKAVFSAGCFWGVEKFFQNIDGVLDVVSGYTGGNYKNPTYEDILKYRNLDLNGNIKNHTEAVEVSFDNSKIHFYKLVQLFFEIHDSTQKDGQGNDIGNNYRSAIFTTTKNQEIISEYLKDEYQKILTSKKLSEISTTIEPLEKFWNAEDYHQDYLDKNPSGYCPNHQTGVFFPKISEKDFYLNFATFKLGKDSESFNVAFNKGTDNRFCKKYELFANTPDGFFVDILSGDRLFDTDSRFNSQSGWLSFYEAVQNSVIEKEDLSYGMRRVEIIAKKSGIHLGHVFEEGGKRRFCINATVIEFEKR